MINPISTDWLSINSLAWSIFRIFLLWLALYGTGSLLLRISVIKKNFKLMPSVIPGMLLYMCIAVLLSVFHSLTREILTIFILSGTTAGLVLVYLRLRRGFLNFSLKQPLILLPFLLAGYILLTNLMIAGRPNMFQDDAHVTYLVQPDRWFNAEHIYFLEETGFSGMPMTSEILSLLPSSLSSNRIDQLILVQLFEMSMLIALIMYGYRMMGFGWRWLPAIIISIAGCFQLVLWGHMAKPDTTALFFVTIALLLLLKQSEEEYDNPDLSAFPVMGLALTSKLTAYLALIPFIIILIMVTRKGKLSKSQILSGIAMTALLPVIFLVRTAIHTGSPFYPRAAIGFLLKPEWVKPDIDLTFFSRTDRSSDLYEQIGLFQNVWHYFREWGSSILLLITGYVISLKSVNAKKWTAIISGIAAYSILSLILFYPAWWGAKYGILLIPFSAFLGMYLLRNLKYSLITITGIVSLLYIFYDSPVSPIDTYSYEFRNSMIASYFKGEWAYEVNTQIKPDAYTPAIIWMNSHLPDGSRVLSFFARKRYLSNHEFFVLERHPISSRLYCDNSLEEEIDILKSIEIDYVLINTADPLPFDGENFVEVLTRMGPGDILEPVMYLGDYSIYEFQPLNYMSYPK